MTPLPPLAFDAPWLLAAAGAAAAPPLLAWRAAKRGRHIRASSVVFQCLALLAAAAALAQPTAPLSASARRPWLLADDVSASLRGQQTPGWNWPAGVPKEDYQFADSPFPAGAALPPSTLNATRIGPLLSLLQARAGQLAGAVIRTDGQFQDADWPAAAAALGKSRLPLLLVPADAPPADARIADFWARRRPDGTVELTVTVAANAHQTRRLTVQRVASESATLEALSQPQHGFIPYSPPRPPPWTRELKLLAGETQTIQITDPLPPDSFSGYGAFLSPSDDKFPENDAATVLVPSVTRRVLVVAAPGAHNPQPALAAAGMKVDTAFPIVVGAGLGNCDAVRDALRPYVAICVSDPTGRTLTPEEREALAAYVHEGGGLVVLGTGPCAAPADFDDPLNKVAPLVANPYQRRPLKLIVILDASGSMGQQVLDEKGNPTGLRKFDAAVEALQSLKNHLTSADALTVIRFAETAALAYDSGPAQIDFGKLHAIDRAITPTGSTKIQPALDLALKAAPDKNRDGLVLIVSDLETQDKDLPASALAARFTAARLAAAAVVTTPDPQKQNPALRQFLEAVHAESIPSERLTQLADLFARFVTRARGEPTRRGAFLAAGEGPVFGARDFSLPLAAFLPSALKPDADVLARIGPDPVIARRQADLGRAVSIAIPVSAAPAENPALPANPAFTKLLAAAVAWAARPDADPRFTGQLLQHSRGRRLVISAADTSGPIDSLSLTCLAAGPGQPARRYPLLQTAPGRYEASLPPANEPETLQVARADGGAVWQMSPPVLAPAEFQALGADWQTLRRLADLTGARIIRPDQLADLGSQVSRVAAAERTALWPWLLALAALLMLTDWCTARILQRGK